MHYVLSAIQARAATEEGENVTRAKTPQQAIERLQHAVDKAAGSAFVVPLPAVLIKDVITVLQRQQITLILQQAELDNLPRILAATDANNRKLE